MKVSIIGWTSWFGLWTANYIKKNFPQAEITVTWRNVEKWENIAKKYDLNFTNDNKKAVSYADITIFSTPISLMEETIKTYAPYAKENSVMLDVCSIKWFPSQTMKKYAPKSVLIIPTHPMFWPYIEEIAGQIFVLTPLDERTKQDERYIWLKQFLKKEWAKVIETTAKKHDMMMAVVQWLTHINMFTVWETIKRLWISVEESLNFVSPIYKLMISSVARYVGHDARLYGDIQMYNTEVLKVHDKFMEVLRDFNQTVQNKDEDSFISIINGTREYFWEKTTSFWQKYTDKIIFLMTDQIKKINENIWKKMNFRNIYNWTVISGIVRWIENDNIVLEDWKKLDINEYVLFFDKN